MSFRILYIKEHENGEIKKFDSQMVILYDPMESKYFYYGTRRKDNSTRSIKYDGHYHYNRIDAFNNFLEYTLGKYDEVITYEMHYIKIDESEYSNLHFDYLINKFNNNTEIFAYDKTKVTTDDMYKLLDSLITHDV